MTTEKAEKMGIRSRSWAATWPVLIVLGIVLCVWYAAVVGLNSAQVIERFQRDKIQYTTAQLVVETWSMKRPLLPAPHQVGADMFTPFLKSPSTRPKACCITRL